MFTRNNDHSLRKESGMTIQKKPNIYAQTGGTGMRHGHSGKHPYLTPDEKEDIFGKDDM